MERGGGRSPEERAAASEARERARIAREQGVPMEEQEPGPPSRDRWRPPDLRSMSRYGGSIDVYARRRLIAGGAIVAVIVIVFVVLVGC